MDLLIIKSGDQYIRVKDEQYLVVALNKASVFPMEQLDQVRSQLDGARDAGCRDLKIIKLILTEEDFEP